MYLQEWDFWCNFARFPISDYFVSEYMEVQVLFFNPGRRFEKS